MHVHWIWHNACLSVSVCVHCYMSVYIFATYVLPSVGISVYICYMFVYMFLSLLSVYSSVCLIYLALPVYRYVHVSYLVLRHVPIYFSMCVVHCASPILYITISYVPLHIYNSSPLKKITVYCQVQLQGFCFVVATTCRHQRRGAIICMGFEPGLSRSRDRHSTAEPRRLHTFIINLSVYRIPIIREHLLVITNWWIGSGRAFS